MKVLLLKKSFFVYTAILILATAILLFSLSSILQPDPIEKELQLEEEENVRDHAAEEHEAFLEEAYKDKKLIALTFDDGPSKYSEQLVDELKKRNVPATFFILGSNAENKHETLKFESDAGNEIGIHSYVHKLFTRLKDEEIEEQIDKTKNIITEATKIEPKLIRVPYGSLNNRVNSLLDKTQLTSVLWTVDSKDWKFRNTEKTYQYVMKKVKGNDIILMHDSYQTSVNAALKIIDTLQSDGYTFVTVSEFLHIKDKMSINT